MSFPKRKIVIYCLCKIYHISIFKFFSLRYIYFLCFSDFFSSNGTLLNLTNNLSGAVSILILFLLSSYIYFIPKKIPVKLIKYVLIDAQLLILLNLEDVYPQYRYKLCVALLLFLKKKHDIYSIFLCYADQLLI